MHSNLPASTSQAAPSSTMLRPAPLAHAALAVGMALLVAVVIWITGNIAPNVKIHGVLLALSVAAIGATVLAVASGPWAVLRRTALASMAATVVAALALGGALSQPETVNEDVVSASVTAAQLETTAGAGGGGAGAAQNVLEASGSFATLAHQTSGRAEVIRTADGEHKLVLRDLATDAGPDLRVYVVAGNPASDGDVQEFIDLGKLKGNEGTQQYDLPNGFAADEYTHVYIWCRAFSVGFGRAPLAA